MRNLEFSTRYLYQWDLTSVRSSLVKFELKSWTQEEKFQNYMPHVLSCLLYTHNWRFLEDFRPLSENFELFSKWFLSHTHASEDIFRKFPKITDVAKDFRERYRSEYVLIIHQQIEVQLKGLACCDIRHYVIYIITGKLSSFCLCSITAFLRAGSSYKWPEFV